MIDENGYDSDDHFFNHKFSLNDKVDIKYVKGGHDRWLPGKITHVLDEMVKVLPEANRPLDPIWAEIENNKVARLGTYTSSEKHQVHSYFLELYKYVEAPQEYSKQ